MSPHSSSSAIECGFHGFRSELGKGESTFSEPQRSPGRPSIKRSIHPSASRSSSTSCRLQPQVLHRHRDHFDRPPARRLVGLSFSWKPGEAYYLPLRGPMGCGGARPGGNARGASADPDRSGGRKDRPEHQVRLAGARLVQASSSPVRSRTRWSSPTFLKAASATTIWTSYPVACSTTTMIPISDLIGKGKNQFADGPGGRRASHRICRRGC